MGERKVTAVRTIPASGAAELLLPLLKEYGAKAASLSERVVAVTEMLVRGNPGIPELIAPEAGRLICLYETLEKQLLDLAREASGLVEHGDLEPLTRLELKLRLDEFEENVRYAGVLVGELTAHLTERKSLATRVRKLIEKSGRYKAPF
jgi:hypothetical protein